MFKRPKSHVNISKIFDCLALQQSQRECVAVEYELVAHVLRHIYGVAVEYELVAHVLR